MIWLILTVSIFLQVASAWMALRLVGVSGRKTAWTLIALANLLMAFRRTLTFYRMASGDLTKPPDPAAETVALVISILMFAGVAGIAPIFYALKRSEAGLKASEERFRRLAEASFEGVAIFKGARIIDVSPQMAAMMRTRAADLIGRKVVEFIAEPDRERVARIVARDPDAPYRHEVVREDGSRFQAEVRIRHLAGTDDRVRVAAVRDLTDSIAAEETLVRAKSEADFYLDLITHDLMNFHHTILGYLGLLEMRCRDDEKARDYLEACSRQLAREQSLIAKVRAYSILAPEGEADLRRTDLNLAVAEAIQLTARLSGGSPEDFVFRPEGEKFARVNLLLDSALINVLENAVKHARGKPGSVEAAIVEAEVDGRERWEIRISDRGPGVPDDMKERIFERRARKGQVPGMGLGLFLAKASAEKLGGGIWVEDRAANDHTRGATFVISLPKA